MSAGQRVLAATRSSSHGSRTKPTNVGTSRSLRPSRVRFEPIDLREISGTLIAQKDSFLCGARGVDVSIAFSRRLGAGFFGGEGFILQKLTGDGLVFLHASGTLLRNRGPRRGEKG